VIKLKLKVTNNGRRKVWVHNAELTAGESINLEDVSDEDYGRLLAVNWISIEKLEADRVAAAIDKDKFQKKSIKKTTTIQEGDE
jgi:hypothetical protein